MSSVLYKLQRTKKELSSALYDSSPLKMPSWSFELHHRRLKLCNCNLKPHTLNLLPTLEAAQCRLSALTRASFVSATCLRNALSAFSDRNTLVFIMFHLQWREKVIFWIGMTFTWIVGAEFQVQMQQKHHLCALPEVQL